MRESTGLDINGEDIEGHVEDHKKELTTAEPAELQLAQGQKDRVEFSRDVKCTVEKWKEYQGFFANRHPT